MKKPAVIIDVDDTIADTQVHLLARINARSARQYLYEELDRTFREGNQPEYEEHMQAILADPSFALEVAPYQDALDAIKILHSLSYELHIVTARDTAYDAVTRQWLREHGFIDFVHHIHHRPNEQRGRDFKREVAEYVSAMVAFDDTFDVGETMASTGTHVYLINRPWNADYELVPNMERSPSFAAAVTAFLART